LVAAVWGIGVALAIYATRHLSCAQLNPAVSIAMVAGDRMSIRRLQPWLVRRFVVSAFFHPYPAAVDGSQTKS